jgi:hypothetical protein
MELGRHDSVLQHLDVLDVGVETAQFLQVVVELYFLQDLGDEVDSTDKTFHLGLQPDVWIGAAVPHIVLEQFQKILQQNVHLRGLPGL